MATDVEKLVERCPRRGEAERNGDGQEVASCGVLEELTGLSGSPLCQVSRDVCRECCRDVEPTAKSINSAIAHAIFPLTQKIVAAGGTEDCSIEQAMKLRGAARFRRQAAPRVDEVWDEYLDELSRVGAPEHCRHVGPRLEQAGEHVAFRCHHPDHETTTRDAC